MLAKAAASALRYESLHVLDAVNNDLDVVGVGRRLAELVSNVLEDERQMDVWRNWADRVAASDELLNQELERRQYAPQHGLGVKGVD